MRTKYSLLFVGLIISLAIFSGCEKSTAPQSMPITEVGMLSLALDEAAVPQEVSNVRGYFSRADYDTIFFELMINGSTASKLIEGVAVGTWNCKIEALDASGVMIYMGRTEVTVKAEETTYVNITLNPVAGNILIQVNWGDTSGGSDDLFFLIMDEDALDNGLHFNNSGGAITPSGPQFFSAMDVNDDRTDKKQRNTLRYFANHIGSTITIKSGKTGDEGWFAPNCIPAKWNSGYNYDDYTCLDGEERQTAIRNYVGLNGKDAIPEQNRLDKIPDVRPLRALGLNRLIGKTVYAVVYDSDISINYDHDKALGVHGNLQGETLGIVVFKINEVRTLNDFSSSTLPEVQITILDASMYGNSEFNLFSAPVPASSSEPNDRIAPGSTDGYYSLGK